MTALNGIVPPDDWLVHGNGSANAPDQVWLLERASQVEGTDFRDAQPSIDAEWPPESDFHADDGGGRPLLQVHLGALQGQRDAGLDGDCAGWQGEGGRVDQLGNSRSRPD